MEVADFPLRELDLPITTLAALERAGYNTFLDIIDLEREDFLGIEGIGPNQADRLLALIDELTVVEGEGGQEEARETTEDGEPAPTSAAGVEALTGKDRRAPDEDEGREG
jgi:hypothetical protein